MVFIKFRSPVLFYSISDKENNCKESRDVRNLPIWSLNISISYLVAKEAEGRHRWEVCMLCSMNKISVRSKKKQQLIVWASRFFIKTHLSMPLAFRAKLKGKMLSKPCAFREKMTEHVFLLLFTSCTPFFINTSKWALKIRIVVPALYRRSWSARRQRWCK